MFDTSAHECVNDDHHIIEPILTPSSDTSIQLDTCSNEQPLSEAKKEQRVVQFASSSQLIQDASGMLTNTIGHR